MKRLVFGAAIIAMAPAMACATDFRQYASLKLTDVLSGRADISDYDHNARTKEFFGLRAAYGMKLADFRPELELGLYLPTKVKGIQGLDVTHMTIMANGYYDIVTNSPFCPYIGAGIGYNRISLDGHGIHDTDASLALRGAVGIAWEINANIALDAGYSYISFGKYDMDSVNASFGGHELSIGARYSF